MLSRLIPIFIAIGVIMHCLPVQRCVVERLAFGASCHGESSCETAVSSEGGEDAVLGSSDAHSDGSCICQVPNAPADRGNGQATVAVDLADLQIIHPILTTASIAGDAVRAPAESPRNNLPIGFVLPLLF